VQRITKQHAEEIHILESQFDGQENVKKAKSQLIAQVDGCLLPIVTTLPESTNNCSGETADHKIQPNNIQQHDKEITKKVEEKKNTVDRRKNKTLQYREARLCLVHEKGSKTPIFSGTFEDVDKVGNCLSRCAKKVGFGENTKIHGVGDGAPWIANQFETQFGAKASYLIDLCHLCEYLSAAAVKCVVESEDVKNWVTKQKERLKENKTKQVLADLLPYIEHHSIADEKAPVRKCYRYMTNRLGQLNYQSAIENDLPIGSGEIESAHRYVIQSRLKIAGAWWRIENAENMIALRTCRINGEWENYWDNKMAA